MRPYGTRPSRRQLLNFKQENETGYGVKRLPLTVRFRSKLRSGRHHRRFVHYAIGGLQWLDPRSLRKEVIQPQVLLRLPCYDFTPIMNHTLGRCPPCGLACGLLVQSTFVM